MRIPSIKELQESRNFWRSQAEGDRHDANLNRVMSGIGVVLAGAGVALVAKGMPEAAVLIPAGVGVAEVFRREAVDELASAQVLEAKVDDRQALIDARIEG